MTATHCSREHLCTSLVWTSFYGTSFCRGASYVDRRVVMLHQHSHHSPLQQLLAIAGNCILSLESSSELRPCITSKSWRGHSKAASDNAITAIANNKTLPKATICGLDDNIDSFAHTPIFQGQKQLWIESKTQKSDRSIFQDNFLEAFSYYLLFSPLSCGSKRVLVSRGIISPGEKRKSVCSASSTLLGCTLSRCSRQSGLTKPSMGLEKAEEA